MRKPRAQRLEERRVEAERREAEREAAREVERRQRNAEREEEREAARAAAEAARKRREARMADRQRRAADQRRRDRGLAAVDFTDVICRGEHEVERFDAGRRSHACPECKSKIWEKELERKPMCCSCGKVALLAFQVSPEGSAAKDILDRQSQRRRSTLADGGVAGEARSTRQRAERSRKMFSGYTGHLVWVHSIFGDFGSESGDSGGTQLVAERVTLKFESRAGGLRTNERAYAFCGF